MDSIKNFITPEEHSELLAWAMSMRVYLIPNRVTPQRFFRKLKDLDYNKLVDDIELRVLKEYKLENAQRENGILGSLLSCHLEGGFVHPHVDKVDAGRHLRFNLFLSLPKSGGMPIYNGNSLDVEEKMLVPYEADIYEHSSTKVFGKIPRIIISFGWVFSL